MPSSKVLGFLEATIRWEAAALYTALNINFITSKPTSHHKTKTITSMATNSNLSFGHMKNTVLQSVNEENSYAMGHFKPNP